MNVQAFSHGGEEMKPELCDEPHKSFRIHEVHIIIIPLSVSQIGSSLQELLLHSFIRLFLSLRVIGRAPRQSLAGGVAMMSLSV